MRLYSKAEETNFPEESKLYFVVFFETGCRVSEGLQLRPEQFKVNDYAIQVYNAPVLKRRKRETRNILIKLEDNPLSYELLEYLDECTTTYLLPRRKQFSREIIPDQATSRSNVYRKVREIDPSLWVHGLRGLRASHLVAERGFNVFNLTKWFNWRSADMAVHYTQSIDMAKALGIPEVP